MLSGPLSRTRKNHKNYIKHLKSGGQGCDFCDFNKKTPQVKDEYKHFWLVDNIFGYDLWDSQGVKEHLMVIPKRHVQSLSQLNSNELKEYAALLAKFEDKGYSVYSRSSDNISLSMSHKHTHLIKLNNKRTKAVLFIRKPHIVVHF